MPKHIDVSVVIPTFNGGKFIEETIRSVLKQEDIFFELIVIDDCSTDDTCNKVTALKDENGHFDNFSLIKNVENKGLMRNANKAAKTARGDYLLFLGHDDVLPSNHLNKMVLEMDERTVMLWCNSYVINEVGKVTKVSLNDRLQLLKNYFSKPLLKYINYISSTSTGALVRRTSFFKAGGYPEKYKHYGEWMLWIELAAIGEVTYTTATKAYYRRHESNMTSANNMRKAEKEMHDYYMDARELAKDKLKLTIKDTAFYILYRAYILLKKLLVK